MQDVEIRHAHIFCGLGGGARGFNRGEARVGKLRARFRCLGGIDNDAAAIADFGRIAGTPGTRLDLFDRKQYRDFHGQEPPADWREATPDDLHAAFQNETPHIVFLSAPCKGFSGLLSESASQSVKYQALNRLTLRGIWLMLEAYRNDPVPLIIFENVPRIAVRGRSLLDQINALLRQFGYAVSETAHDCGEIGGLGQSRKRFLLVARHQEKVPPFLYEPPKRKLRGVGEILDKLPVPGFGQGGAMHRIPSLQWKTWVRLAFVLAGSDWRSLNQLRVEDGQLADFGIIPEQALRSAAFGVVPYDAPSGAVIGESMPSNGRFAVADPRHFDERHTGMNGVRKWDEHTGVVTGRALPNNGAFSVADPRIDGHAKSVQLGVREWKQPAATVTGQGWPGQGPFSVADPRHGGRPKFNNVFRIVEWSSASPAVTAGSGPTAGGLAVADPRPVGERSGKGKYKVTKIDQPAGTVIASSTTGEGAFAVADPRDPNDENARHHSGRVTPWDQPGGTVTASRSPGSGALVVADPRLGPSDASRFKHNHRVTRYDEPAGTITSAHSPSNGAGVVADPRYNNWHPGASSTKLRVTEWDKPGGTVTGSQQVASGALSVADPRPEAFKDGRKHYEGGGHYGVIPWEAPARAVTGSGCYDNGRNSVADPREAEGEEIIALPKPTDRLVAVIRALDDTWHRPFTTLELAALQSLVDPEEYLELEGLSDASWRERIGNAVPPEAAQAIASVMGKTLLLAWSGESFMLSSEPIWVQPLAIALAIKPMQEINDGI